MTWPTTAPVPSEPGSGSASHRKNLAVFLLLATFLSAFAFWDIAKIPFHPDESTYLYMSSDFETLFSAPLSLAWSKDDLSNPSGETELRLHYRLIDPPMTRYLLGFARWVGGLPQLPADWNWAKTWEQNQAAGALPDPALLNTGRAALTFFIPLDLLLIYLIGIRLQSRTTGLLAALLFGLNALVLLHNRRAMTEAALTFGVLIALFSFLDGNRRPWFVGLALAFAMNSKQTAYALLPIGLLALAFPPFLSPASFRFRLLLRLALNWAQVLLVIILITLALNPFLWKQPVQAIQAAWQERQDLMTRQVNDFNRLNPDSSLNTPAKRMAAMLANLYMTPPAFAETANYSRETAASEQQYLSNEIHHLLGGVLPGGMLFALTLAGMALAGLSILTSLRERRVPNSLIARRRFDSLLITLMSTFTLGIGIFWLIPLPWQRYLLPLVPFVCLWVAYAITTILSPFYPRFQNLFQSRRRFQP